MRSERTLSLTTIDGKRVTATLEDGQELTLDRSEVSPTAQVGDAYVLTIQPAAEAQLDREELARTLLNELLRNE